MKSWNEIRKWVTAFSQRARNACDEKTQTQTFLKESFALFGVDTVVFNLFEHRAGRQIRAEDAAGITTFAYDEYGSLANETVIGVAGTNVIERVYDGFGRLDCDDGTTLLYAPNGLLTVVSNGAATASYRYSSDGLDFGYSLSTAAGATTGRSLTRDGCRPSLITEIANSVNGAAVEILAYTYDTLSRPIARNADTFGYNDKSEVISENASLFGYDESGNSTNWNANCLNQYAHLAYDADGNLISDGMFTYAYDADNRLKTISTNGVLVLTNHYDAKSRRVRKVTPEATTTFFYDDWNLIEERIDYTNGMSSTIHYCWGKDLSGSFQGSGGIGGLLSLTITDTTGDTQIYIPFYDNNGNITRYLDASGSTAAQYTYDAFGKTISASGSLADVFHHRFSTKYFDAESSLYYYGYRFYNPSLMRWFNRDPLEEEGGMNLYVFCENIPLIGNDLLGLKWKIMRKGQTFAKASTCSGEDSFDKLSRETGLDFSDYKKWAHTNDSFPVKGKEYRIPNVKIYHKGWRRIYENLSYNVIGNWDDNDNRHIELDKKLGFQVIVKNNISNSDVSKALSLDGLYEYTFTGHGAGDGNIVTNDPDSLFSPNRITLYGIHKLSLQGCDTANDITTNGNVKYVGWASNVAVTGFFIGYMGGVNRFTVSRQKIFRHGTNSTLIIKN